MPELTEFYHNQLTEVLKTRSHEFEARWLLSFGVGTVGNTINPVFKWNPDGPSVKNDCNYLHPNALTAFGGGHVPQVEGYAFEDFARGAATIASVLHVNDADRLADLIKYQMEIMHQRVLSDENPYPNLCEKLFPIYTSCVTLILLNDEHTAWQSLISYTLGFLWVAGLVDMRFKNMDELINTLFLQVKRGTYY